MIKNLGGQDGSRVLIIQILFLKIKDVYKPFANEIFKLQCVPELALD